MKRECITTFPFFCCLTYSKTNFRIYESFPFKFFRILAKFIGGGFPAINIVVVAHPIRWLNKFLT